MIPEGGKAVATHTLQEEIGEDGGTIGCYSAGAGNDEDTIQQIYDLVETGSADPVEIATQYGTGYLDSAESCEKCGNLCYPDAV